MPSPHGRIAAVEIADVVGRSGGGVDAVGVSTIGAGVKRAGPSLRMRSLRVADASEVRLGLEVKLDQSQESELHNPGRQVEVASRTRCQYRSLRRHQNKKNAIGCPISEDTRSAPDSSKRVQLQFSTHHGEAKSGLPFFFRFFRQPCSAC